MNYGPVLIEEIRKNGLKLDEEKIVLAYEFANEAHIGQYRRSGEAYMIHPVEVAKILINMKMDTETIVAGLLHDIVEDTLITTADIEYNFGATVAKLVDGVTKLKHLPEGSQKQLENIRKMIVAMAKDVRVVIIKLADRLHNMRTLKHMPPEKQQKISKETLEIFAPIAHRLGMARIKWELEDISLYYLDPDMYRKIVDMVDGKRAERELYTENVKNMIQEELGKYSIEGDVVGRPKHFYSIYKKMVDKSKEFYELYDLIALRVVLKNEADCYYVLGIIHNLWKPVPGRFKDYIAVPKSNGYQSIHTTVVGPDGKFVEIQIRTQEMNGVAEDGIAAHWKYKENSKTAKNSDNVYSWLKKILEWQHETDNSKEFIENVTGDLLSEEVFVFSPAGDVIELPKGATPLDFAFNIHTQIGYKCIGAKINGRIVPLDYKLENGDRIEIITSKTAKGPGKDWLKLVVTTGAKNKIKKWFKEQEFVEKVKEGKIITEKEFAQLNFKLKDIEILPEVSEFMRKHNIPNFEELMFQIGIGKLNFTSLIIRLKKEEKIVELPELLEEKRKREVKKNDYGIVIDGTDNTAIRFAKCCTPLPGDEIKGYVSRGKGITVHRVDCKNYMELYEKDRNRLIEVRWDESLVKNKPNSYSFNFNILVADRVNILMEIINVISEHKINILGVSSISFIDNGNKRANIRMTIEIREIEQFNRVVKSIMKVKDVIEVKRN